MHQGAFWHLLDEFDTSDKVSAPNSPVVGHVPAWPDAFMSFWQGDINRTVQLVRWGLIPGWVKDPRTFPLVFNARSRG